MGSVEDLATFNAAFEDFGASIVPHTSVSSRNNWVIMSMPRQVMQLARKSVQVQPVRGKAVSNWKRPTMDEYLAPHEAYGPANAKRQKSYNMFFLGGVLSFMASLAGGTVLDVWEFNPYPHHLMTNAPGGVRGTPLDEEE